MSRRTAKLALGYAAAAVFALQAPAARATPPAPSSASVTEGRSDAREEPLLSVAVAIEAGSRDFRYVDRITPTLRPYSLLAAPLVAARAEIYPLARAGVLFLKDLGATAGYARAIGLSSQDAAGASVSTSWSSLDFGLNQRIPAGSSVVFGLHGGFGEITYSLGGGIGQTAQLPDVEYRFLRAGANTRVLVGPLALYAYGSYLGVLSTGSLGTYFERASAAGVEARLGVAYPVIPGLEVSLGLSYTRFFYSLHPTPGDAYVAGGALDQMGVGVLEIAYVL